MFAKIRDGWIFPRQIPSAPMGKSTNRVWMETVLKTQQRDAGKP
jgi:hypothetical protein